MLDKCLSWCYLSWVLKSDWVRLVHKMAKGDVGRWKNIGNNEEREVALCIPAASSAVCLGACLLAPKWWWPEPMAANNGCQIPLYCKASYLWLLRYPLGVLTRSRQDPSITKPHCDIQTSVPWSRWKEGRGGNGVLLVLLALWEFQ